MATVNIYRINPLKLPTLEQELEHKGFQKTSKISTSKRKTTFILFYDINQRTPARELSWEWLLLEFSEVAPKLYSPPKAVLICNLKGNVYAVTFGHSFFLVDKFADKNFPFEFARRVKLKKLQTTTTLSPNSQKNKTINSFVNYDYIEFNSNEAFAKVKFQESLSEGFKLYSHIVEAGNSLRIVLKEDTLHNIEQLLKVIEGKLKKQELNKIPVFGKITDKSVVSFYDSCLSELFLSDNFGNLAISEFEIIGANEIFYTHDQKYTLKHNDIAEEINVVTLSEVDNFCKNHDIMFRDEWINIKIIFYSEGIQVVTKPLRDFIECTLDEYNCMLVGGIWYNFNGDFMEYLRDSICEIDVIYDNSFDFSKTDIDDYNTRNGKNCYREAYFNKIREQDGYECYDRQLETFKKHKIEVCDLYKDEILYAVKVGKTSEKLCYVVDQSLTALRLNKNRQLSKYLEVRKACLWIILSKKERLTIVNGKPDINELKLLHLKMKIDSWKKEVRLMGLEPIIYINYYNE